MARLTVDREAIARLNEKIEAQRSVEQAQIAESTLANTSRFVTAKAQVDKPPFVCQTCGETREYEIQTLLGGVIVNYHREACACEREQDRLKEEVESQERDRRARLRIAATRERGGFVGKLASMRLETFVRSKALALALKWAVDYLEDWPHKRGGFLVGPFGCGKTHLAVAVGNELIDRGENVGLVTGFDLLERIRRSYDRPDEAGPDVCETVANAPVLIYDDLGNERIASDERGEWAREKILRVFYWRDVYERPTIVTSNYTKKELGEKIGFATLSRIIGLCEEPIVIDAPDYRVKTAVECGPDQRRMR